MQEEEITRVTVKILGEDYVLRSDSSPEHIRQVARLVDDRMQSIANTQPQLDISRLAIMAALSLADDLLKQSGSDSRAATKGSRDGAKKR
jgi:cell division protein ZapA